jgi:hypothetical protein
MRAIPQILICNSLCGAAKKHGPNFPIAVFLNIVFKHLMGRLEEGVTLCHHFYIDRKTQKRKMQIYI